ncbi:MAG: PAS domain S-box protein [Spirochaetales bacterium]|nr:PAS domain S-box protein [Spirochaetales bacterium]
MNDDLKWKQAEQQLKDLQDVIIELAAQSDLEQGLRVCLDSVIKISGLDGGGIYLTDKQTGALSLVAHKNLSDKFIQAVSFIPPEDPWAQLIMKGEPVYIEHAGEQGNNFPDIVSEKIKSLVVIPVKYKKRVICSLNIISYRTALIPGKIRQSLTSIGAHIGSAIRRLQSETAIAKSEQLYSDLVETAQDLIWQCDAEGRYIYLNPAWEDVMGYSVDEMLGKKFTDFQRPEQGKKDMNEFSRLLSGGVVKGYESCHIAKDGKERLLVFNAKYVRGADGEIFGTRGTAYDITGRVRTAKELQERIAFEELLSDISSMLFAGTDKDPAMGIREALKRISGFLDADRGSLFGLSEEKNKLVLLSHYVEEGVAAPELCITEKMLPWYFSKMNHGEVVILDENHPPDKKALNEFEYIKTIGMKSVISIPLLSRGSTSGMISFSSFSRKRIWPMNLVQRLRLIGEIFMNVVYQYRAIADRNRIFTYSMDMLATAGFDGFFKALNPAWERTLGWSPDELCSVPFLEFVHSDDRESTVNCMSVLKLGDSVTGFQNRYKCKNGEYKWISWNSFPLLQEQLVFGVARDITKQKKSEEVLRESEGRYFQLFNNTKNGVIVFAVVDKGKDFILKDINEAGAQLYRNPKENLIGKSIYEILPAVEEYGLVSVFRHVLETGESESMPVSCYHDNSFEGWFDNFVYLLPTGEIVTVCSEVTESKRSEKALRENEERMRAIIENSLFGAHLYETDSDGDLIFIGFNRAADEILGVSHRQFVGKTIEEAFPLLAETEIPEMYRTVAREGTKYEREQFSYDDHQEVAGIFSIHAFQTGHNRMAVFFRDVTEKRKSEEKIRESEERYRLLLQNANDMVFVHEIALQGPGRFIDVNEKACRLLGYSREELCSMEVSAIDTPEQAKKLPQIIHELYTTGHSMFLTQHVKKNRERIPVEVSARLFKIRDKDLILSVARDITERFHAQREIQEREVLLKESQKVAQLGHYTLDIQQETWQSSEGLDLVFGIGEDYKRDIEGWITIVHPEHAEEMFTYLQNHVIRDLHLFDREYRIIRRNDKVTRWVHGLGKLELDENSRPVRMFGTIQDVTERKQAEEQLAAEKERLSVTLRSIGDAVISTDTDGKIVLMNSVAEKLTGWKLADAVGKNLTRVFHIIDGITGAPCANPVDEVLASGEIVTLADHTVLVAKDGSERLIVDSGAPIKDSSSRTIGVVLVFRDNTEKHQAEANLIKTQKLESLGLLAGGIAHDFNNLLGGIFGYIEIARDYCASGAFEEIDPLLEKAVNVFGRAKNLTQQLLTFSKGGEPVKKTGDVGAFLRESVQFALSGSNVQSRMQIQQDLWTADFDENQIGQVIDNIIINAKHAMPSGGIIRVTARNMVAAGKKHPVLADGEYICISIQDEGEGIPREHLAKVFDPFFTTKKSGSGLGLATSYSIIKKHSGHIELLSEESRGTMVTLYLPASKKKLPQDQPVIAVSKQNCGRILVMDDEEYIREIITAMLSRFECSVQTSRDGDETIRLCKKAKAENDSFNIIICDLTIPGGKGGKDIVNELKKIMPESKIIASSGYSEDPVMAAPENYGFFDCIRKPYRLSDLNALLQSAIDAE